MSRTAEDIGDLREGFPRVSGDEPAPVLNKTQVGAFSPRERG